MEKSQEERQAQLAAFAAERIESYADRRTVFAALSDLALRTVDEAAAMPLEISDTATWTKERYVKYLRDVGGRRYENIGGRKTLLDMYAVFEAAVADLKQGLTQFATPEEHPAFLGKGSSSRVYAADIGNTLYAVRIPRAERVDPGVIDGHVAAALLGRWAPHLEQVVAASYKHGVTVAEIVPGTDMAHISVDDVQRVRDTQIEDLIDTLLDTQERGINIDPKPSNLLYDPLEGYGIVDYQTPGNFGFQGVGETVGCIASALGRAGLFGRELDYAEQETYQYVHRMQLANLSVVRKYQAAARERLSHADYEVAASKIDPVVASMRTSLQECGDPAAVAARIERTWQARQSRTSTERRIVFDNGNVRTIE